MVILLDIDGVLVPVSTEKAKIAKDGFMPFDKRAAQNLAKLITATNASVILTTNHRVAFLNEKWVALFNARDIPIRSISKINKLQTIYKMMDRATEIKEWIDNTGFNTNYVIIDDDYVLNNLPHHIKNRWVMTDPTVGLDDAATEKALNILLPHKP
jgi:hypothetical protein